MQSVISILKPTAPRPASTLNSPPPLPDGDTLAEIGSRPRPVLPEKVSDIELTPEEIEAATAPAITAAINRAKQHKYDRMKTWRYWWDVANPAEARRLNLNELKVAYMHAAERAVAPRPYALDNGLKDILHMLALYFSENPEFEAMGEGYSLQKGLMIVGTVGVGKTRMMELWGQVNPRMRFGVLACDEVADAYASEGVTGLLKWYERRPSGICFDDLGTEMLTTKNFGNEVAPMERLLRRRHELQRTGQLESIATHITTNLTWDELRRYGPRLVDRCIEMFNIVAFDPAAPSRRR